MTHSMSDSTAFDTSDTDSLLTTKQFISNTAQADESSINLFWSLDKQIVLYSQEDVIKAGLFQTWWDLTSYEAKFLNLKQKLQWRKQATHKKSVWSHFIERVNIMQEESRVICNLCLKNLAHFSTKKSEINALWNYLDSKDCKNTISRSLSLQELFNKQINKINFIIDLSHRFITLTNIMKKKSDWCL